MLKIGFSFKHCLKCEIIAPIAEIRGDLSNGSLKTEFRTECRNCGKSSENL